MKRFRIIKKVYNGQERFVPQYKYLLFPFVWYTFNTKIGFGGCSEVTFYNQEDAEFFIEDYNKNLLL